MTEPSAPTPAPASGRARRLFSLVVSRDSAGTIAYDFVGIADGVTDDVLVDALRDVLADLTGAADPDPDPEPTDPRPADE